MAEALPPEVERMASFGRALEGTVDITQEDIDEVPSDEGSPSASRDTIYWNRTIFTGCISVYVSVLDRFNIGTGVE